MFSNLHVSDDAKALLEAMVYSDGKLHRRNRGLIYEAGDQTFQDDNFQRWGLAVDELLRLQLIASIDGLHSFEVT